MTTLQIPFIFNKQIVIYRPCSHAPALSIFCLLESTGAHLLLSALLLCYRDVCWGCDDAALGVWGSSSSCLSRHQALTACGFVLSAPDLLVLVGNLI